MKYILFTFFLIFSTACSQSIDTNNLYDEWWGDPDGRFSQVIKIDKAGIYYPKSAGHYSGKWTRPLPYSFTQNIFGSRLQFKHHKKEYEPKVKQPDENTLQLIFDKKIPWSHSVKGQTLTYKRAPKYVEDGYFHGQWINRKGGFKSLALEILPDGNVLFRGVVSGADLCWLRNSEASIKVEFCDKTKAENMGERFKDFYIELTPTPVKELIVVEMSNKKSLWKRPNMTKLNWLY